MAFSDLDFVLKYTVFDLNFSTVILVTITFAFVLFYWLSRHKLNLPRGPVGLPIVGYLPFLGKEPFRTLDNLSKKYGNVFSLYLGRTYVVILADFAAVKDAFSKTTTLDRPPKLFDFLPDGVGFSSVNGQEWVEQRRYSVRAMRNLGLGKNPWELLIDEEVSDFVKLIESFDGQPIDVCKFLTSSVSNNICSLVLGKRLPPGDPTRDFLDHSIDTVSQFFAQAGIRNYFPWLCDILVKLGIGSFAKCHADLVAFNEFIKKEVKQHKNAMVKNESDNFIDGYLLEMESKKQGNAETTFNEINLRGNIQALLVGGSDTTRTSINWILLAMASYPDKQERVHLELDSVLGTQGKASWENKLKLPYTYAVILEGQRWKTIAPLNTSRIAQEDIKICGYDIPKGSTIIANNWGLHNDKRYWPDPEEFIPERFLKNDGEEVILKPDSYVPFSYGKRNCPGETVATIELLLYFTALMQRFKVLPPEGEKPKFEAILGITYQAVEQKLRFIRRH